MMYGWLIVAMLMLCGCAAKTPAPVPDPPAVQTITIPESGVGKKVLIEFADAPKHYTVSCCLPKGVTVVSNSGKLWLSGTPTQTGTFKFTITPN